MRIVGMQLQSFMQKLGKPISLTRMKSGLGIDSHRSSSSQDEIDVGSDLERSACCVPADVPEGHLAVYVGSDTRQRFVVKAEHLNHHLFKVLLDKAAEEYGFVRQGGLIIPCEPFLFKKLIALLNSNYPSNRELEFEDLVLLYGS
ncbi:hypothetical protein O6H91_10G080700 [Diphasiastrum complanatum]|uniref:Uncharacterized protein n=1 Tax=Diphasiastrum complanatum TaxID=34168 RepID=A0ACC2CIL5_DIPCM|nr:hypothetical protein O6H91_10G080700 [Diphasiastrum complanatum]